MVLIEKRMEEMSDAAMQSNADFYEVNIHGELDAAEAGTLLIGKSHSPARN